MPPSIVLCERRTLKYFRKLALETIVAVSTQVVDFAINYLGHRVRYAILFAGASCFAFPLSMSVLAVVISLAIGNTAFTLLSLAMLLFFIAGGLWAFPQLNRMARDIERSGAKDFASFIRQTSRPITR